MKRLIIYTIAALLCLSCQEDNLTPQKTNPVISNITMTLINESTAKCTFTVNPVGATQKAGVTYSTDPASRPNEISTVNVSGGNITLELNNLIPNALYYYQVYIMDINDSKIDSDIERFITNTSPDVSVSNMFCNRIVAEPFVGGNGTQSNPYLIANAQQLKKLLNEDYSPSPVVYRDGNRFSVQATYFKLMTDIIVTADEWIPIGCSNCNFDGNGHTISGTLKSDKYEAFGFFGYFYDVYDGNHISNLTISAAIINEHINPIYTGAIAGLNSSSIINCHLTGTVTGGIGNNSYTGGIVGYNGGEITNCTVSVTGIVTGRGDGGSTGGIAGYAGYYYLREGYSSIVNCTNHAAVSGKGTVGGIVGYNYGEIHTSLSTGNISGDTNNTGGLAGWNSYNDYTHIYSCCTNNGTINGQVANTNNQIGSGKAIESCPDGHTKR